MMRRTPPKLSRTNSRDGLGRRIISRERLQAVSGDFGNAIRLMPSAAVAPRTAAELRQLVSHCAENKVRVVARGAGHSTEGQSQTDGGVLVLTHKLQEIRIQKGTVTVGAGVRWATVVRRLAEQNLRVPVLPDYLDLSVGGTLSVGGVGKGSHVHGLQIDNVVGLEVVTGHGRLVRCSRTKNAELFKAVLGGVGMFGIITRATLRTIPATRFVHIAHQTFEDWKKFAEQLKRASLNPNYYSVAGHRLPDGTLLLEITMESDTKDIEQSTLVDALGLEPSYGVERYVDFVSANATRETKVVADRYPSWLSMMVPGNAFDSFVRANQRLLRSSWCVVIPILKRRSSVVSLFQPAAGAVGSMAFGVLFMRTAKSLAELRKYRAANSRCVERLYPAGGRRYLGDGLPTGPSEWARHLGPRSTKVASLKAKVDPNGILGPTSSGPTAGK